MPYRFRIDSGSIPIRAPKNRKTKSKKTLKTSTVLVALLLAIAGITQTAFGQTQSIESMPPVVVKTIPESGAMDVASGEVEIKVSFSKEMTDKSWSWSTAWQDSAPEFSDKPRYDTDHKTCIARVKLEPNKTYAFWLNSANFHGFQDRAHHPAVPYLLIFKTKAQ